MVDRARSVPGLLFLVFFLLASFALADGGAFTNSWAVQVDGGDEEAEEIAARNGFTNLGRVGSLEGVYHFRHDVSPSRSARSLDHVHHSLMTEEKV